MPWINPAFMEPMYCPPCGRIGIEHVQRLKLTIAPFLPTAWLRACPDCFFAGWRLVGQVVPGVWIAYLRRSVRAA